MGVNQRLRIEFAVNKKGADNFKPPSFKNFRVVGGPSQSISQSYVNGKFSYSQSYTYIIQPKIKGELNIPAASIEFNGKTIKSEPVKNYCFKCGLKLPKKPKRSKLYSTNKTYI